MFDYIKGILAEKGTNYAVISNGGIGFHIEVPIALCEEFNVGDEVKLFTHFVLARGEVPVLYGFLSPEQRKIFHYILGVSGIGPRLAMNILGCFDAHELSNIIANKDVARLRRVPKLGPKKAQLLLVELEGNLSLIGDTHSNSAILEAQEALVSLGYKVNEASTAIQAINQPNISSQELVKLALKNLTKVGNNYKI